jgi:hypothetical protein
MQRESTQHTCSVSATRSLVDADNQQHHVQIPGKSYDESASLLLRLETIWTQSRHAADGLGLQAHVLS